LENYIKKGVVVDVPMQTLVLSGVVLEIQDESNIHFDIDKLKPIV
jgi:hypothetical protein